MNRMKWLNSMNITVEQLPKYVKREMVNGKLSTVCYNFKKLIPVGMKFKTDWLRNHKRKLKPDSEPLSYYSSGGDTYGLYSIEQTQPTRGN